MATEADGNANTVAIVVQPGLVFFKIAEPIPNPERTELLLRKTMEHWFSAHPGFLIEDETPVTADGRVVGFHVRYQVTPTQSLSNEMAVHVDRRIHEAFSREYIEAVVNDAMGAVPIVWPRGDAMIVVNRRRIALAIDLVAGRGIVVPVEQILDLLDEDRRDRLHNWLAGGEFAFHVLPIERERLAGLV